MDASNNALNAWIRQLTKAGIEDLTFEEMQIAYKMLYLEKGKAYIWDCLQKGPNWKMELHAQDVDWFKTYFRIRREES